MFYIKEEICMSKLLINENKNDSRILLAIIAAKVVGFTLLFTYLWHVI
jgi:hypothetical protein